MDLIQVSKVYKILYFTVIEYHCLNLSFSQIFAHYANLLTPDVVCCLKDNN